MQHWSYGGLPGQKATETGFPIPRRRICKGLLYAYRTGNHANCDSTTVTSPIIHPPTSVSRSREQGLSPSTDTATTRQHAWPPGYMLPARMCPTRREHMSPHGPTLLPHSHTKQQCVKPMPIAGEYRNGVRQGPALNEPVGVDSSSFRAQSGSDGCPTGAPRAQAQASNKAPTQTCNRAAI